MQRFLKSAAILTVLLLLSLLGGCRESQSPGAAEKAKKITITDSYGRQVEVSAPPGRIISLNPNVTEMLYVLGTADKIIALSDGQRFPPQAKERQGGRTLSPPN